MEILKGVMIATSSSGLLQNHRESWVGLRNVDDLLDSMDRTGLKEMCFNPIVSMCSLATSIEGTPVAIVNPSIGTPAERSC